MGRYRLRKLYDDGDVFSHTANKFLTGVRTFYECATSYALTHLPLVDEVLANAQFVEI